MSLLRFSEIQKFYPSNLVKFIVENEITVRNEAENMYNKITKHILSLEETVKEKFFEKKYYSSKKGGEIGRAHV